MNNTIGTCSNCGGPVTMPSMMVNPVPSCERCGARPLQPHGPVIPMGRPLRWQNGIRSADERDRHAGKPPHTDDGKALLQELHWLIRSGKDDSSLAAMWPHDSESIDETARRLRSEAQA